MIENMNINVENNEPLSVKVSLGDELRRTSFNGTGFEALRDAVAKLFGLEAASIVLKYQDDDGDKITMSSDGEVKDALQQAKEKKLLRLFVEIKPTPAPAPAPAEEAQNEGEFVPPFFPCGRRPFGGPMRGGFRGPFGFGPHHRGGPHHGPHFGPGPHHGGPREFPHPHPPHHHAPHHAPHHEPHHHAHPHHGPHHHASHHEFTAAPGNTVQFEFNSNQAPLFAHGTFSPAGASFVARPGPYGGPWAHKAHKHAMKEHMKEHKHVMKEHKHAMKANWREEKQDLKQQIKLMKENATTEDDFLAIKEFKKQIRAEWKNKHSHGCESGKKNRFVAKHVADVTIPDNSELTADTPVTKTWRLRNDGASAWPADSQLVFISRRGDNINGPERVPVGPVEPQQELDVSVAFITPSEPGRYIGYYRMATGDGAKFGQRVWVSFIIPNKNTTATTKNVDDHNVTEPTVAGSDIDAMD